MSQHQYIAMVPLRLRQGRVLGWWRQAGIAEAQLSY
jgi:hypothetical protein